MTAFGFMHEVQINGVKVPEDVSVVGFDGIDLAQYSVPALTTVKHPSDEMGKAAAEMLLELLADDGKHNTAMPPAQMILPVTLQTGRSTAPPKTQ